jgi:hypothetical protein
MSRIRLRIVMLVAAVVAGVVSPAVAEASSYEQRDPIRITKNDQFTLANGVRSGSGTAEDPYVISGWKLSRLEIRDTSAHVVIRDNHITSHMVLDWIGPGVTVEDNLINDLRVNQNVRRTGAATSGVIRDNRFGIIGQLRHFDGVFTRNRVDVTDSMFDVVFDAFGSHRRAVNFDGWNGARFTRNVIRGGYVEVRLHGHHHGSGFGEHSHHHAPGHAEPVDHSKRYHRVWVSNNEITVDEGPALIYTDTAHVANDRTAASEQNEELNKPHQHWTQAYLRNNTLRGGGVQVQIFNARDERHVATNRGILEISGNEITLAAPERKVFGHHVAGIDVWDAVDVDLRIEHNRITGPGAPEGLDPFAGYPAGLRIDGINKADIYLLDNKLSHFEFGLELYRFGKDVTWHASRLKMDDVRQPVRSDGSTTGP